jgi:hypothetical protein
MAHHTLSSAALLSLALAVPTARLAAQAPERRFSISTFSGGVVPFGGAWGDGEFRLARDDGARFTVELNPVLAVRAAVTRALRETSGVGWGQDAGKDIETWHYGAEVVAGPSASRNLRPYVFGGAGLAASDPRGDGETSTTPAIRAGLGVQWRPGRSRLGALLEAGGSAYRLKALGVRQTQLDFAWNGGLSLHW